MSRTSITRKTRRRAIFAVLAFLLNIFGATANLTFCEENSTLDLTTLDAYVGEELNIGEFGGGALLTLIFTAMWMFPLLFARSSKILIASLFIGIASLCACVAFTWCPIWVLVVISFMVALGFGSKIKDAIS